MSESDPLGSDIELELLEGNRVIKKRLVDERYKDLFFLFLFGVNIVVVIGIAFSYGLVALRGGGPETVVVQSNGTEMHQNTHDYETIKIIGGILVILSFAGSVSACWIYFLSKYASSIISAVLMCVIMGTFLSGVGMIGMGFVSIGACLIALGVTIIIGSLFFRPRIDFAAANLKIACEALVTMPTTLIYALLVLAAQIIFIIIWVIAASGYTTNNYSVSQSFNGILYNIDECTTYKYSTSFEAIGQTFTCTISSCQTCICGNTWVSNKACFTSKFYVPAFFGLLLSLFWTSAVCANIVHCTTSASVATWWATETPIENDLEITRVSFQRACTSSLGSICFGSLLVAIVRVFRSFMMLINKRLKTLNHYDSQATSTKIQLYVISVLEYTLNLLDRVLVYFNRYAFCFVAIYGYDFLQASKHAMDLFASKGWTALLNDDIIDLILNLGNILIGAMTMCVGHYYARLVGVSKTFNTLLSLVGLFGGYLLSMVAMSTISSAVATVYVCYADNPDALKDCHPEEYYVLSNIWNKVFSTPSASKQPTNRRIVLKTLDEDSTGSTGNTGANGAGDDADGKDGDSSSGGGSNGSRTVRGSYKPPLPSDAVGAGKSRPFGFHIFNKRKNQSNTGGGGEDSYSTVQLSTFVNDTAGYGRSISGGSGAGSAAGGGGTQQRAQAYGGSGGNVLSSSMNNSAQSSHGGGYELSESQKEALKVPLDLYHAAASMFGSTFMTNHVNNNTNVDSSSSNYGNNSNRNRYAHGVSQGLYSSVSTVGDDDGGGGGDYYRNNSGQSHVEESLSL